MKKCYFAAIAALFCVLACNKTEIQPVAETAPEGNSYSITFTAPEQDSKLTFGDYAEKSYKMKWQVGDVLQIFEIGEGYTRTWKGETDPLKEVNPDGSATFTFTIDCEPGTRIRFQQNNNLTETKTYGASILQAEQVYDGTGVANLADVRNYDLNYISQELKLGSPVPAGVVFYRNLATVRIPFKSTTFKGWTVDKVYIRRADGGQVAGQFGFDGSVKPEKSVIKFSTNKASDFVSVSFSKPVTITEEEQSVFALLLPTYIYVKDQETPAVTYKVGFQISNGGEKKFLSAKFSANLASGTVTPLKFGTMLASDEDNDYYSQYQFGADIKIGDLIVNKKTFPTADNIALADVTYATMRIAGVHFIDDKACGILDLHTGIGTNQNIGASGKSVVMIGRYAQKEKQSTLEILEMRTVGDIAFLNLTLKGSTYVKSGTTKNISHIFSKNSSDKNPTALRLQDCVVDGRNNQYAIIGDRNGSADGFSAPYSNIYFDNCVVICSVINASEGTARSFYRHYEFFKGSGETTEDPRTMTLNNNQFIWRSSISAEAANLLNFTTGSDKDGSSPGLKFAITNNNIINCPPAAVVKFLNATSFDAQSYFERNILFMSQNTLYNYGTAKVFYCPGSVKLGKTKDNYASADRCYKKSELTTQVKFEFTSAETKVNNKLVQDIIPFTTWNVDTGYVVIDPDNTDISSRKAGATTKTFVPQE